MDKKYGNYKSDIWNENIIGKRIIAWISNGEMILSNDKKQFRNIFFENLIKQVNFVKKNINNFSNDNRKISSISSLILSGLVFKEYFNNYSFGLKS